MRRLFILFLCCFFFSVGSFAATTWTILPEESSLGFTGTMNESPASGQFKSFNGVIRFDPEKLNESYVRVVVDTNSVNTSYVEIAETLKAADWFDVKLFPEAVFEAKQFIKKGDKSYEANGTLTIRDKKLPVVVHFTEDQLTGDKVKVKGSAKLKRTAYGVGKGEWGGTDEVGDDVVVNFAIVAKK